MHIDYFVRPEVAQVWANTVSTSIMDYLKPLAVGRKHGGMMIWWVVIKESQYCSILKNDLNYIESATLLQSVCPEYFKDIESLAQSFRDINKGDHQERRNELEDTHGKVIRKILITSIPKPRPKLSGFPSLTDVIVEIAERMVDTCYTRMYSSVKRGQVFAKGHDRIAPPVSILTFPDDAALQNNRPSSVVAFEQVDGELSLNHVYATAGQYAPFGNRYHPIMVARSVASEDVVRLLDSKDFGLCIVNQDGTWHRMLSRGVNDFAAIAAARQAIFSGKADQRLIVYNKGAFTTLPELLRRWGVSVRNESMLKRPILSKDDIKSITADYLHEIGCDLHGYCVTNQNLVDLTRLLGVKFSYGYLPDYQLELCDFDSNEITLNLSLMNNIGRGRFSLTHGCGHYAMHKPYVSDLIYTYGESQQTLYASSFPSNAWKWLEWQADSFGHYSLMPDEIMWNLYHRCVDKRTQRMGVLYVDDNPWNLGPFLMTLREMSRLSLMSMEALTYRLIEMGLLNDQRTNRLYSRSKAVFGKPQIILD